MAQHIPLERFKQKKFIAIRQQIEKAFNSPRSASYLKGSLKYIWDRKPELLKYITTGRLIKFIPFL